MTLRSDLVDALEVAITDEAYDGGLGPQTEVQYSKMVRKIAEVAAEVVEGVQAPTEPRAGMIAPEDGMTLDDLGEAMEAASEYWDGDESMHSIVHRFIQHYAEIDGLIDAARAEQDYDVVEPILFRWDDENFTLVRVGPEPQGEPSDAQVQAALDAAVAQYATTWVGEITQLPVDFDAMRSALRAAGAVR